MKCLGNKKSETEPRLGYSRSGKAGMLKDQDQDPLSSLLLLLPVLAGPLCPLRVPHSEWSPPIPPPSSSSSSIIGDIYGAISD